MEKFIDPCCEKCFNSKEKPCEQFVECCLSGPLCHENETCALARRTIVNRYSHSPHFQEH